MKTISDLMVSYYFIEVYNLRR